MAVRSGSADHIGSIPDIAIVKRLGDADLRNTSLAGITTGSMSVLCLENDTGAAPAALRQGPSKGVATMAKKPETDDETSTGSELLQSILAVRVRNARRRAKLKQSDLAALIGNSQSFVFLVEAADANITLKSLVKIAEALQMDPVHLLMSEETSNIISKSKVEEFSALVQTSLQELHATTSNLTKINECLQQLRKLLTDQKENLNVALPSQD